MFTQDDRTEAQRITHTCLVVARDKCMSGWGRASNISYCAWACRPRDTAIVLEQVRKRKEMLNVRLKYRKHGVKGKPGDHLHIYVGRP